VHRADSGGLAVVGVMFSEGKPNATFGKNHRHHAGQGSPAVNADATINPNGLLPAKLGYYQVPGLADDAAVLGGRRVAGAD